MSERQKVLASVPVGDRGRVASLAAKWALTDDQLRTLAQTVGRKS